jgi:acetylornithine deacetylase/succinyl-diaminopimelate desuccinylase-like protein
VDVDWTAVQEEVTGYLCDLVRFDTTNPPGNELPAAEYLRDVLAGEGFEPTVLESAPNRGQVVARMKGTGEAQPLLLLSHLDVVPVERDKWERDPFGGEVVDGVIWGRGTIDTKELTAMQLMVLLLLKRQGFAPKRDIIMAATADEEAGGKFGVGWLVENHWPLIEAEYAINEGGGFGLDLGGRRVYVIQTAEKGVCWMKLRATGKPGHGSTPHGDNAVVYLVEALARIAHAKLPQHRTATVDAFIKGLAGTQKFPASALLPLVLNPALEPLLLNQMADNEMLGPMMRAMLHNTATPTVLSAGQKTNVVPSEATGEVDGRLLPGQSPDDLVAELKPYLGDKVEVEFLTTSQPCEVNYRTPLYGLCEQVLQEHDPGCAAVPFMITGSTDGRYLAMRGVKVYGFAPLQQEPGSSFLEMAHGHNERLSVKNLMFGTRVLYEVVRHFCV